MSQSTSPPDPFGLLTAGFALWADGVRNMQANYMEALGAMAGGGSAAPEDAAATETPALKPDAQMQQYIRAYADMNMKAWTQTANMVSALPDWARWPTEAPGRALTDMFDQWRVPPQFGSANKNNAK